MQFAADCAEELADATISIMCQCSLHLRCCPDCKEWVEHEHVWNLRRFIRDARFHGIAAGAAIRADCPEARLPALSSELWLPSPLQASLQVRCRRTTACKALKTTGIFVTMPPSLVWSAACKLSTQLLCMLRSHSRHLASPSQSYGSTVDLCATRSKPSHNPTAVSIVRCSNAGYPAETQAACQR